jgi:uncharacterized membrane protein YphA (DoxX/SURF4 family)
LPKVQKPSFHFLRVGLAITFLWVGVLIFKDPAGWGAYMRPWAAGLLPVPIAQAMAGTAVLDITIGALLLVDYLVWLAALLGALHLIIVLAVSGVTEITVRDVGLLVGALALMMDSLPAWIMDRLFFFKKTGPEGKTKPASGNTAGASALIEFYGKECPHCLKMAPLVLDLQKNLGILVEQREVWHDDGNLKIFRQYDKNFCGGVPFFINAATGESICGETTYDSLEKLAKGEKPAENHSPLKNIDFNHIINGIYIGTNQCCRTHFDQELSKLGIEADISLEETRVDSPFGIKYYFWLPVKNHEALTQEQLDFGVSVLRELSALNKKVYVHCQNGHGRAPSLVAAYLVSGGKNPEEAIAIIKNQRPAIHLNDVQMQSLVDFAKRQKPNM